ncbi:MAG: putative Ig domain-containing protein [Verrucomicrobiales bacterium]|nr:putative Ig domain-containing protein [Verrucomicrobiales bacterium]
MTQPFGHIARRLIVHVLAVIALLSALPASAQVIIYRFELKTDRDFNRDSYESGYLVAPFSGGAASLLFTTDHAKTYNETAATGNFSTAVTDKKEIQWVVTATSGGTATTNEDGTTGATTGVDTYLAFGPADSTETFRTLTADISTRIAKKMKGRVVGASSAVSTNHPGRIGSAAILDWNLTFDESLTRRSNKTATSVADGVQDVKDYLSGRGYLPEGVSDLTVATTSLAGGGVGTAYSATLVASGGSGSVTWAIASGSLPDGLSLSGSSISGTPTTPGTSSFTVRATDSASPAQTATRTLSIVISSMSITTASLPTATNGTAYTTTLAATNGIAPLTWSVDVLPSGLTLNTSTGVISGTPVGANTTHLNITATDSSSPVQSVTTSYDLTVTLVILNTTMPVGTVGTAYAQALTASGGKLPLSWSVKAGTSLPSGLTITGSTITGTPDTAGTTTFTLVVTDDAGVVVEKSFDITIN